MGRTTNTNFLPALESDSFRRILLPAVLTILFCIYVLLSQYTCSTYFLFFCVFFLAPNRPQQLGNEGFARNTGIKKGSLLIHRQTSSRKRTNAKSQPVKKLVVLNWRTRILTTVKRLSEKKIVSEREFYQLSVQHKKLEGKKGQHGNCQFILTVDVRGIFVCFLSHSFHLKSIRQNQKSKTEKKLIWNSRLVFLFFFRKISLSFLHLKQKHWYLFFFFLVSGKENSRFFLLIPPPKVFLYVKLHIFRFFFFLKRLTYHRGFQKYFIRSGKVLEYTTIAAPRKNGREVTKLTAHSTGKNRKITSANSEGKSGETTRISKASFRTNKPL